MGIIGKPSAEQLGPLSALQAYDALFDLVDDLVAAGNTQLEAIALVEEAIKEVKRTRLE